MALESLLASFHCMTILLREYTSKDLGGPLLQLVTFTIFMLFTKRFVRVMNSTNISANV